jgi:hypothetical protein
MAIITLMIFLTAEICDTNKLKLISPTIPKNLSQMPAWDITYKADVNIKVGTRVVEFLG